MYAIKYIIKCHILGIRNIFKRFCMLQCNFLHDSVCCSAICYVHDIITNIYVKIYAYKWTYVSGIVGFKKFG